MYDTPITERTVTTKEIKFAARNVQVFYGDTHAIKDVDVEIEDKTVTAFIGPSGCGKSTFLRCLNRMNDTIDVCRVEGDILLDGEDIYDRIGRPGAAARQGGHGVPETQPVPEVDLRQYRLRPAHPRLAKSKADLDEIVEKALRRGAIWDEVKDRLHAPAPGFRAGSSSGCASHAPSPPSPRFCLMDEPCSALDPIATSQVEELIDELRANFSVVIVTHSMQQAARVSQKTAFFHLGNLVEFGETGQIFTNPKDERTESYITGPDRLRRPPMQDTNISPRPLTGISTIQALIMKMGGLVEENILNAAISLEKRDEELAEQVRRATAPSTRWKNRSTRKPPGSSPCAQPTAVDLRTVLTVMKISSNLERIGDYAKNMAKRTSCWPDGPINGPRTPCAAWRARCMI
jgi:phosphate transport system ATP-binding protein